MRPSSPDGLGGTSPAGGSCRPPDPCTQLIGATVVPNPAHRSMTTADPAPRARPSATTPPSAGGRSRPSQGDPRVAEHAEQQRQRGLGRARRRHRRRRTDLEPDSARPALRQASGARWHRRAPAEHDEPTRRTWPCHVAGQGVARHGRPSGLCSEGLARAMSVRGPKSSWSPRADHRRDALEQDPEPGAGRPRSSTCRMPDLKEINMAEAVDQDRTPDSLQVLMLSTAVESALVYERRSPPARPGTGGRRPTATVPLCRRDRGGRARAGENILDPALHAGVFAESTTVRWTGARPVLAERERRDPRPHRSRHDSAR